ncbi:MAG: alcohol dehydrogenase catalytic domain-containing protein [Alphaproteobacteria bacterium]|nr:alcohol dehydrogenase catalytic domain-containing protein [Alphaproteobacteria bacterium]
MKSQALVEHGAPLREAAKTDPVPKGTEVLLRVAHCGVCHSDVHLQDGYFGLGGEKKLDTTGLHHLPFILGHEIEGEVAALGEAATGVKPGERRVAFPWIGCGDCAICTAGAEHLCNRPRALGIHVDGGFSDRVMVPHPRYLLDHDGIPADLAATYMCSGLTAFSALKKIGRAGAGEAIAIVGLGGVGMMGLRFARALFPEATLIGADIDERKRKAAADAGAELLYDSAEEDAAKRLIKETQGGVAAAIDFVGSEASLGFANRVARKGGKVVIVGLFGGRFSMPIPMFPLRAISLIGSYVGSLAEAQEMLALVRAGQVSPIPLESRPLDQANRTLDDLRAGRVVGRVVLDCAA